MDYGLQDAKSRDYMPFYTGLDRAVLQAMMPIAGEVGMGRRSGKRSFISDIVYQRPNQDTRRYYAPTLNAAWRVRFRKIYAVIVGLCRENAPQHLRHAELLSLCELNRWMTPRELKRMDELSKQFFSEEFRKRIGWD